MLHVLRRGISAQDRAGIRFDVYGIDFGCYVQLLTTNRAPLGRFAPVEGEDYVEVPADDYRSIRRAILDLDEFERFQVAAIPGS